MHPAHLALAAALAFAACGVGASSSADGLPGDLIEPCLAELTERARAEDDSDSHIFNLHERCPRLAKDLDGAMVSGDLKRTSVEGLRDLRYFEAGFQSQSESKQRFAPDFAGLDALLADVLVEESIDVSLWDRFLRWLEQFADDGESPQFNRFLDWLEDLDPPPWLGDAVLNTSVALILLLALMVVGNELRLSGVLRRQRRAQKVHAHDAGAALAPVARATSIDALRGLPPRELAAAALRIVTDAFVDRGWVSANASLTNGELVRQVGQRQSGLANPFSTLVSTIETVIYGDRPADDEGRKQLLDATARLVECAQRQASTASKGEP